MNVIILAAGKGTRMNQLTKNKPKCFLKINGKTLIERLLSQLKRLKFKDISIVTGYKSKAFNFKNIKYFFNKNYENTNMFYSLMKAKSKMKKDALIIYSDVLLSNHILKKMSQTQKNFAVAVDTNWKKYWKFRFGKINRDLETLKINNKNQIQEIGKTTKNLKNIDARYIGIIKTSKKINKKIISIWKDEKNKNKPNWGISGNSANKAFFTDVINRLINKKNKLTCNAICFKNGWYEFDNEKDYYNYKKLNFKIN